MTVNKPKPNRNAQSAKRQLTIVEREIAAQEIAVAELDKQLEDAGGDYEKYAALYEQKTAAERQLEALMERWEALAAEAGE